MPADEEVQFLLSVERDRILAYRRNSLLSYQAWVRRQYETNDVVVLLDMAECRAEHHKTLDEDFVDVADHLDLSGGQPLFIEFCWGTNRKDRPAKPVLRSGTKWKGVKKARGE